MSACSDNEPTKDKEVLTDSIPAARIEQKKKTPSLQISKKSASTPIEKIDDTILNKDPATKSDDKLSSISIEPVKVESTKEKESNTEKKVTIAPSVDSLNATKESQKKDMSAIAAPDINITSSDNTTQKKLSYQPQIIDATTNINIILDASGSMAAPFNNTSASKFDIVRSALLDNIYDVIQRNKEFPRNIGIRAFGSEKKTQFNDCNDATQLIPISDPILGNIKETLEKIQPQGMSPIGHALQSAISDFPKESDAEQLIVLIADGSDSCQKNTCELVEQLKHIHKKLMINVVAFDVTPLERDTLECIANKGDGRFFMARDEMELRSALTDAINASTPYNLKLNVSAGKHPLPFKATIFPSDKQRVLHVESGIGTKMFTLAPGSYDIVVQYADSPELKQPSHILKGVDILEKSPIELNIPFELGQLTLSAIDSSNQVVPALFKLTPIGNTTPSARIETTNNAKTVFITPQHYKIHASLAQGDDSDFIIRKNNIAVTINSLKEEVFRFQKGTVRLNALTSQKKSINTIIQVYKADIPNRPILNAAFGLDGGTFELAPNHYTLIAAGILEDLNIQPITRYKNLVIEPGKTTDIELKFEMGQLQLHAVNSKKRPIPSEFIIKDSNEHITIQVVKSLDKKPLMLSLPPGSYDITAKSLKSPLEPRPTVQVENIVINTDKTTKKQITFILGTLRLRGRNSREQHIETKFKVFKSETGELISESPISDQWVVFDLEKGLYDILAVDTKSKTKTKSKSSVWLRELTIRDGKTISHEAIFTAGKLKIIGRGPNNRIIKCHFKIFQYGFDRELISGETGNDWEIFEIDPGKYYLEASFKDEELSVVLKKWINIKIEKNQIVEQELRF